MACGKNVLTELHKNYFFRSVLQRKNCQLYFYLLFSIATNLKFPRERCVTSQKMAAKETMLIPAYLAIEALESYGSDGDSCEKSKTKSNAVINLLRQVNKKFQTFGKDSVETSKGEYIWNDHNSLSCLCRKLAVHDICLYKVRLSLLSTYFALYLFRMLACLLE